MHINLRIFKEIRVIFLRMQFFLTLATRVCGIFFGHDYETSCRPRSDRLLCSC